MDGYVPVSWDRVKPARSDHSKGVGEYRAMDGYVPVSWDRVN